MRLKSRREKAGQDRQILGSGMRTEEALESRNLSDPDSGRCSGNSSQGPGEELEKSRNNSKSRAASESCTSGNSMNTQKGTRYRIDKRRRMLRLLGYEM